MFWLKNLELSMLERRFSGKKYYFLYKTEHVKYFRKKRHVHAPISLLCKGYLSINVQLFCTLHGYNSSMRSPCLRAIPVALVCGDRIFLFPLQPIQNTRITFVAYACTRIMRNRK